MPAPPSISALSKGRAPLREARRSTRRLRSRGALEEPSARLRPIHAFAGGRSGEAARGPRRRGP
jgi:hypothetical protein